MTCFKKLSPEDEDKLALFLSLYPETSMFLCSNLRNSSIEYKSDSSYHEEYSAYCNSLGEIQYHNQGYARSVVALCLLEAKKNGVKQAILFTNNLAAERAYFSIGFKKIGEYRLAILRDNLST